MWALPQSGGINKMSKWNYSNEEISLNEIDKGALNLIHTIDVVRLNKTLPMPEYQTEGAAGFDLYADIERSEYENRWGLGSRHDDSVMQLRAGERALVKTGIKVAIPEGFELQIRPRSGLALKNGISIVNSPGTIDSDYRGEIGIILINHSRTDFIISHGDRIAQAVFAEVNQAKFNEVEELDETERGEGGFGSTNKKK